MPKQNLEEKCDVEITERHRGTYVCPGGRRCNTDEPRYCEEIGNCIHYLIKHNLSMPK